MKRNRLFGKSSLKKVGSLLTGLLMFSGLAVSCSDNESGNDSFTNTPLYQISMNEAQTRASKVFKEKTAAQVYSKLEAENPQENVCFSPLSLQMALSLFTHSCGDNYSKEVADKYLGFFGVNSLDELGSFNSMLIKELPKVDGRVKFTLANSIWEIGDFGLDKGASWMKNYGTEIFGFPTTDPSIVKKINDWTLSKTNNRISLLDPNAPAPDEQVMYVNALYFLGKWSLPFTEGQDQMTFTDVNGEEKKVNSLISPYNYDRDIEQIKTGEADGRVFSVIPFGNGGYRMYAVLPAEGETIAECAEYLSGINFLPENAGEVKSSLVTVPAFEINYDPGNLSDILDQMGYPVRFETKDGKPVSMGIKQKTFFKMTKDGAEGAGVTSVSISTGTQPPFHPTFDRPFIYYVMEQSTGTILFIGSLKTF